MAVAIEMRFAGATLAQYDDVLKRMGLADTTPPGALFHWAAATDDGLLVVDVWESMEQFDSFARDHIGPQTQAAGITEPPKMTTYEVHNTMRA